MTKHIILNAHIVAAFIGGIIGALFSSLRNKYSFAITLIYMIFGGIIAVSSVDYIRLLSPFQALGLGVILGIIAPHFANLVESRAPKISDDLLSKIPVINSKKESEHKDE